MYVLHKRIYLWELGENASKVFQAKLKSSTSLPDYSPGNFVAFGDPEAAIDARVSRSGNLQRTSSPTEVCKVYPRQTLDFQRSSFFQELHWGTKPPARAGELLLRNEEETHERRMAVNVLELQSLRPSP